MNVELKTAEQVENLRLLRKIWIERVSPDAVNLETWSCGSVACLGGHVAQMPEFQAKGVVRGNCGAPRLLCDRGDALPAAYVAGRLFGSPYLFDARNGSWPGEDDDSESDWSVALRRLNKELEGEPNL